MEEKKLSSLDINVRREILLMALTFRVSKANLMKMFHTTNEDIEALFKMHDDLKEALEYLDYETVGEDEINSRVSYVHALEYWRSRNRIIKQIKEISLKLKTAENNDVKSKYELDKKKLNVELKKLHEQIDDTLVYEIIKNHKRNISELEWEMLSRYYLKYALDISSAKQIFGREDETINKYRNLLAEKDPIFAEKINMLAIYLQKNAMSYLNNALKGENYIRNIQRDFQKSENVDLNYFNRSGGHS